MVYKRQFKDGVVAVSLRSELVGPRFAVQITRGRGRTGHFMAGTLGNSKRLGDDYLSLHGRVIEELRQAILSRRLKPGERLIEDRLADELGVSRNPVREAIRVLESEGLVEVTARRGASVFSMTDEEARETIEVRALLEGQNARLAARRVRAIDAPCCPCATCVRSPRINGATSDRLPPRRPVEQGGRHRVAETVQRSQNRHRSASVGETGLEPATPGTQTSDHECERESNSERPFLPPASPR